MMVNKLSKGTSVDVTWSVQESKSFDGCNACCNHRGILKPYAGCQMKLAGASH